MIGMFFENDNVALRVIDVLSFEQKKKVVSRNSNRPFYALSYRKKATNTVFEYDNQCISVSGKSIVLVPAQLDYIRTAENETMTVVHFLMVGEHSREIKVFYPALYEQYEKCFDEMLRVWNNKEEGYKFKCNELLYQLLYMIRREEVESEQGRLFCLADRAARMIEREASSSEFSVSLIAPRLNVSGTYLRKKFQEKYGMSPQQYLTEVRIELARSLLKTKYFSVKEVARRCGFENEKYFSTVFKEKVGISPKFFDV